MAFDAAQLQAFSRNITVISKGVAEDTRQDLIRLTNEERQRVLAESRARSPQKPTSEMAVDGKWGAPLNSVKPDGRIVIEWGYLAEVATGVDQMIRAAAPELTGAYENAITVYLGQPEVRGAIAEIGPETDVVVIASTVPYSRRLELGHDAAGGAFIVHGEIEFIKKTGILARRRYGAVADIIYQQIKLDGRGDLTYPALRITHAR